MTVGTPARMPHSAFYIYVNAYKRWLIGTVLRAHEGNRTRAARALGLQRTHMLALMRRWGIR